MLRRMRDKDLYATILGIGSPWSVIDVVVKAAEEVVEVHVALDVDAATSCPECTRDSPRYDTRTRRWRHLDTCQYRTLLVAEVPRVRCPTHGVRQLRVPWAEPGSHFTALFEGLVIDWLKEASLTAVGRQMHLSWDEVAGIQERAVRRGLARRRLRGVSRIGVDETSFARRHEYVTLVTDLGRGHVLHVADGRGRHSLDRFFARLTPAQRRAIEVVAMDMWGPFIASTRRWLPDADHKIAFDKFHVASHLGDAVDKVRRAEHRELLEQGDRTLVGTKYLWLQSPTAMSEERAHSFESLRRLALKVARAWQMKELAMGLWWRRPRGALQAVWERWCRSAKRVRLEPVRRVARMIEAHLQGILTAIQTGVTNALSEGTNSKVQWIKKQARGFRNRLRFRHAILFHLGGLDLYPSGLTHTES